jgi:5-methylthioadenosine/S-adenosylhomocysteine deaminase
MSDACDLIVRGDFVLPMTDGLPEIENGAVAVRDGAIVGIGSADEVGARWTAADEIAGGIVLPGLINTHGHAAMTLYRGLGDDMPLEQWLEEFVWPAEKEFTTPENVAAGTRLAIAEMLASGTTAFADMYFFQQTVGEVAEECGIRALLGQAVIGFPVPGCPTPETAFEKVRTLHASFEQSALVDTSMALHAVYTLTPDLMRQGAEVAGELGIPLQIHLSETRTEVEDCRKAHGVTPPELCERTGVLREGTICAHGVHLTPDDVSRIVEAGAGVSLNPESNLKLASGIPDIAGLLAAGVRLGLGTDGAASNNDLDLWDSVRLAALLPKGTTLDPTVVPAQEAARMATAGGARLFGWQDRVGTLEVGKRADLCVVDTGAAHMTPLYHATSHLAYATHGDDVVHTVVDGRVVYRDRRHTTLDLAATCAEVRRIARDIAASH